MICAIITLNFLLYWTSVLAEDNGVFQIPSVLWHKKAESAEMKCNHNKDFSFNQMYWYRQRQRESMEFIVYKTANDTTASARISAFLVYISSWMMAHHLKLNPSKTELLVIPVLFGKDVDQSPADVLCLPDVSVTLTCNHSISNYDSNYISNWYQRTRGDTELKLIGHVKWMQVVFSRILIKFGVLQEAL
ncbi:hypothetical protein QTP86_003375 [Hemibagrus guttatus]|nr:hypothetical protein QTP86_003375 [Hemibagrus guttatus]